MQFGNDWVRKAALETVDKLDEVMLKRGGKLERRVGWGEREGLLGWERYLDVW